MNAAPATPAVPGPGRKLKFTHIVLFFFILLVGVFVANVINPAGTQREYLRFAGWWYERWPLSQGADIFFRVTQTILTTGIWEVTETGYMNNHLKPGDVFVDVGAHVGYYTLLAAKLVGESGKVIAVEPNPPTIVRLERDIALNPFRNIVVRKVACTDKETTLKFFQAPVENTGESSINKSNAREGAEISVPGVPLDKIVQELGIKRVDLVKIDVEGAEMSVLGGMTDIIATYHPKVAIELKDNLLKNMGSSLEAVKELFMRDGYTLEQFDGIDNYYWAPGPQPGAR